MLGSILERAEMVRCNDDFEKSNNRLFCFINLTLVVRYIGIFGLVVTATLSSILIYDGLNGNYLDSSKIALFFGLDFFFHPKQKDSGGILATLLLITTVVYTTVNLLLILASINHNRCCSVPWLICEFCSCVSKTMAVIHHRSTSDSIFIIGSACYIVLSIWCWLAVYHAQLSWQEFRNESCSAERRDAEEMLAMGTGVIRRKQSSDSGITYATCTTNSDELPSFEYMPTTYVKI